MASEDEVQKLAALARLSIQEEDLARFAKDFESILSYIGQIETLNIPKDTKPLARARNVFREDGEPHETGMYTKILAAAFPEREGDALKVKKILHHD
ncbi:MAG: Asp-tRNA(Asn)/Glu-tRNA(Gln) amidotransferase GatCAB subunit C [Minisyncoccia bacterium]